jgi:hypothetical protein
LPCELLMNFRSGIGKTLVIAYCLLATPVFAGDGVSGNVLNRTTNRPSVGDEVVLLRMGEGMQEEARTKTDAEGKFFLHLAFPASQYVLRVLHQGVNYDNALQGSPVQLDVFDAGSTISGRRNTLGIAQLASDGEVLTVTEMYSIINASAPPTTLAGPRNFEVSLPTSAALDFFRAKGPQGLWVNLTPVPVLERPGRYAVDFPLRPGDTLFKFSYHLPSRGATTLSLKLAFPIQSFAVLHPPSMSFRSLRPRSYTSPGMVKGLQIEQVVASPVAREVPAFEISGIGSAPLQTPLARSLPLSATRPAAAENHKALVPVTAPTEADQRNQETWAIGFLILFLLTGGLIAASRRKQGFASGRARYGAPLVEALKEELLQLESERSRGLISAEQYRSTRDALNLRIRRALDRGKA